MLLAKPDGTLVNIRHDRARVHATRALAALVEREANGGASPG